MKAVKKKDDCPLLEVRNLKKYFPITAGILRHHVGDIKAVDGVDFTINQGEVFGMVGESGSGKSTAARAAIRLIEPTSGEIFFDGKDLRSMHGTQLEAIRREIQVVFQDPYASLNPRQTVGESIGEALLYHKVVKNRLQQRDYVAHVMKQIGLSPDTMDRYPHQFSGGQQQRICIGRAIAGNPKLIVCDEAVSSLDVSVQAQILNLLVELKDRLGLSYFFISHDLSIVRHICDRVAVLYAGKIVEMAPVEELFQHPKHPYTRSLLSAIPPSHPKQKRI
jgi:ABC-type oligopeptide transport system ATPase subunit